MLLSSSRIYGLDILRASAILLVLTTHSIYYYTNSWDNYNLIKFIPDGVSIFFVLSGFLIGNILIKTIQKKDLSFGDLKNFWIRRWFRTLPAYYFVLSLLLGITRLLDIPRRPVLEYLKYFLFFQAFTNGNCNLYNESWSLCVEEFFYFSIPAILFFLIINTSFSIKTVLLFCILFVIASVTMYTIYKINIHHYNTHDEWDIYIRKTVFTRLNSIMFGFLGAYLMYYHYHIFKYKTWMLIVRPAFGYGPSFNYEQLSLESIAALLLIPKLSTVSSGKGILFKILTFISSISYSIYLINYTPFYWLQTVLDSFFNIHSPNLAFIRLVLFLFWSIGVAYLLKSLLLKNENFFLTRIT
jgi:peptidoglycan/LPS O-acetylase OafA/YrhL